MIICSSYQLNTGIRQALNKKAIVVATFTQKMHRHSIANRKRSREAILSVPNFLNASEEQSNLRAFERLSRAYKILTNRKPLKHSVSDCYSYYKAKDAIFADDLMTYPKINKSLLKLLFDNFDKSSSIRVLLLNDLGSLLIKEQFNSIFTLVKELGSEANVFTEHIMEELLTLRSDYMSTKKLKERLAFLIIIQATFSGEHLLATKLALDFHKLEIQFNPNVLNVLLKSLSIDKTLHFTYNAVAIMKLLDVFGMEFTSTKNLIPLADYMLAEKGVPYFANILHDKLFGECFIDEESLCKFSEVSSLLISRNLQVGNLDRALKAWFKLNNLDKDFITLNLDLLSKLLDSLIASHRYQDFEKLLHILPQEAFGDFEIMERVLKYYGCVKVDQRVFENLVNKLEPPLNRLTLSVLLEAFLMQNNDVAHDKILPSILKLKNGINHNDFNAIISKLLRQHKLEESISMTNGTDVRIAKASYISILKYVLFHQDVEFQVRTQFIERMVKEFMHLPNVDDALRDLAKTMFQYILNKINNRLSRKFYSSFAYKGLVDLGSEKVFDFRELFFPQSIECLILIDDQNRLDCLRIIGERAVKDQDFDMIKWTMNEMRLTGMILKDIIPIFQKFDPKFMESVFKKQVIQNL